MTNLKRILALLLFMTVFAKIVRADAQDTKLATIGANFNSKLPADWKNEKGSWAYFDAVDCFVNGPTCFGNNPTTPYGFPQFVNPSTGAPDKAFRMASDEAVVIIMRTPPELRYYAFTQYLMNKGSTGDLVFASLSDSLNNLKIATTGSTTPGQNVYDQHSAVVWTGDTNTFASVRNKLIASGLPSSAINFIPLPVNLPVYPLHTGYGAGSDTYGMLMRAAIPTVPGNFASYMTESPFIVQKVGPSVHLPPAPAPTLGYAPEISGKSEAPALQTALNMLVKDIQAKYSPSFTLRAQTLAAPGKVGWDCIAGSSQCAGDNHDALYTLESKGAINVTNLEDIVIIAGVNHKKTGKTLYTNHSVYDTVRMAGIVSVADPLLTTQSALYHAGIINPGDVKNTLYKNLYAYVISYNCARRLHCVEIPKPTATNPVGLEPGAPFFVLARDYVDPLTGVRPSPTELIPQQVFFGMKK